MKLSDIFEQVDREKLSKAMKHVTKQAKSDREARDRLVKKKKWDPKTAEFYPKDKKGK